MWVGALADADRVGEIGDTQGRVMVNTCKYNRDKPDRRRDGWYGVGEGMLMEME
jgi:hypothetical protein